MNNSGNTMRAPFEQIEVYSFVSQETRSDVCRESYNFSPPFLWLTVISSARTCRTWTPMLEISPTHLNTVTVELSIIRKEYRQKYRDRTSTFVGMLVRCVFRKKVNRNLSEVYFSRKLHLHSKNFFPQPLTTNTVLVIALSPALS